MSSNSVLRGISLGERLWCANPIQAVRSRVENGRDFTTGQRFRPSDPADLRRRGLGGEWWSPTSAWANCSCGSPGNPVLERRRQRQQRERQPGPDRLQLGRRACPLTVLVPKRGEAPNWRNGRGHCHRRHPRGQCRVPLLKRDGAAGHGRTIGGHRRDEVDGLAVDRGLEDPKDYGRGRGHGRQGF